MNQNHTGAPLALKNRPFTFFGVFFFIFILHLLSSFDVVAKTQFTFSSAGIDEKRFSKNLTQNPNWIRRSNQITKSFAWNSNPRTIEQYLYNIRGLNHLLLLRNYSGANIKKIDESLVKLLSNGGRALPGDSNFQKLWINQVILKVVAYDLISQGASPDMVLGIKEKLISQLSQVKIGEEPFLSLWQQSANLFRKMLLTESDLNPALKNFIKQLDGLVGDDGVFQPGLEKAYEFFVSDFGVASTILEILNAKNLIPKNLQKKLSNQFSWLLNSLLLGQKEPALFGFHSISSQYWKEDSKWGLARAAYWNKNLSFPSKNIVKMSGAPLGFLGAHVSGAWELLNLPPSEKKYSSDVALLKTVGINGLKYRIGLDQRGLLASVGSKLLFPPLWSKSKPSDCSKIQYADITKGKTISRSGFNSNFSFFQIAGSNRHPNSSYYLVKANGNAPAYMVTNGPQSFAVAGEINGDVVNGAPFSFKISKSPLEPNSKIFTFPNPSQLKSQKIFWCQGGNVFSGLLIEQDISKGQMLTLISFHKGKSTISPVDLSSDGSTAFKLQFSSGEVDTWIQSLDSKIASAGEVSFQGEFSVLREKENEIKFFQSFALSRFESKDLTITSTKPIDIWLNEREGEIKGNGSEILITSKRLVGLKFLNLNSNKIKTIGDSIKITLPPGQHNFVPEIKNPSNSFFKGLFGGESPQKPSAATAFKNGSLNSGGRGNVGAKSSGESSIQPFDLSTSDVSSNNIPKAQFDKIIDQNVETAVDIRGRDTTITFNFPKPVDINGGSVTVKNPDGAQTNVKWEFTQDSAPTNSSDKNETSSIPSGGADSLSDMPLGGGGSGAGVDKPDDVKESQNDFVQQVYNKSAKGVRSATLHIKGNTKSPITTLANITLSSPGYSKPTEIKKNEVIISRMVTPGKGEQQDSLDGKFFDDNDPKTGWSPSANGDHLMIDLGKPTLVGGLKIQWRNPNNKNGIFDIQTSLDGKHFLNILDKKSIKPNTTEVKDLEFPHHKAKFMKIIESQGLFPDGTLSELKVYQGKTDIEKITILERGGKATFEAESFFKLLNQKKANWQKRSEGKNRTYMLIAEAGPVCGSYNCQKRSSGIEFDLEIRSPGIYNVSVHAKRMGFNPTELLFGFDDVVSSGKITLPTTVEDWAWIDGEIKNKPNLIFTKPGRYRFQVWSSGGSVGLDSLKLKKIMGNKPN